MDQFLKVMSQYWWEEPTCTAFLSLSLSINPLYVHRPGAARPCWAPRCWYHPRGFPNNQFAGGDSIKRVQTMQFWQLICSAICKQWWGEKKKKKDSSRTALMIMQPQGRDERRWSLFRRGSPRSSSRFVSPRWQTSGWHAEIQPIRPECSLLSDCCTFLSFWRLILFIFFEFRGLQLQYLKLKSDLCKSEPTTRTTKS